MGLGHAGVLRVLLVFFLFSVSTEPFRAPASSVEELKNENGDVLLFTAGAAAESQMRETTKAQQLFLFAEFKNVGPHF